jgi:Cu(I)/Ag(I) efflux system membrane fusion protein
MNRTLIIVIACLAVAAVAFIAGMSLKPAAKIETPQARQESGETTLWTCSMHPQIIMHKPGKCPICAMDLVPVKSHATSEKLSLSELTLSPEAIALSEIETARVERKFVQSDIRLVGKVAFDETRLASITARFPGRLDRLYVDYTGIRVNKGDHMVYMYSPELLVAQEELIQAVKSGDQASIDAVRGKLRLWGLADEQIAEMEKLGAPADHITIYAPLSGIVTKKNATEGTYVDTGTEIYAIADLSQVWVVLDAYESNLVWLRYGQKVEFQAEAYPGDIFEGRIAFISPMLDDTTRTVKVRIDMPNPLEKLKPEMFVHAIVHATVDGAGRVIDPDLADKWVCPMHPGVIKDEPGKCPICGMTLVQAKDLGYSVLEETQPPLVIPATAPLITGKRAVVYIATPDRPGTFTGREILLGPRAGDYYIVRNGLAEGEFVVTKGNFKIDSAVQIQAGPSMMSPSGGAAATGHVHGGETPKGGEATAMQMAPHEFMMMLDPVYAAYFKVHAALFAGDLNAAKAGYTELGDAIGKVDKSVLTGDLLLQWNNLRERLSNSAVQGAEAATLADARDAFRPFSDEIIQAERWFSHAGDKPHYLMFSREAVGGAGASWLQETDAVQNPYLSGDMHKSGEMRERLMPMHAAGEMPGMTMEQPSEIPLAFRKQMNTLLDAYLQIHAALVKSDKDGAASAAKKCADALKTVDMNLLTDNTAMTAWMNDEQKIQTSLAAITSAEAIDKQRESFSPLSDAMAQALRTFGYARAKPVTQFHCPMANADWLQEGEEAMNPYYGEGGMLHCAENPRTIPPSQNTEE